MKIYLTATALLLSACASGPVQKPCQDAARVVIVCDPHYADCACNQARDNGTATIAKPSKPKPPKVDPEEPEVDDHWATPGNEPESGTAEHENWEKDWNSPGGGRDQTEPGWRDQKRANAKAGRNEKSKAERVERREPGHAKPSKPDRAESDGHDDEDDE